MKTLNSTTRVVGGFIHVPSHHQEPGKDVAVTSRESGQKRRRSPLSRVVQRAMGVALLAAALLCGASPANAQSSGICDRTDAVESAILAKIDGVTNCASVTASHLSSITGTLDLWHDSNSSGSPIASLQSGDFAGLSALRGIDLSDNDLTTLPSGVFTGLASLANLDLYGNDLATLPSGIFTGLTSLTALDLYGNDLTTLPSGIFTGLTSLEGLGLHDNDLTTLPSGIFTGLTSLTTLDLSANDLTTLPSGIFTGLTSLDELSLSGNGFACISAAEVPGSVVNLVLPLCLELMWATVDKTKLMLRYTDVLDRGSVPPKTAFTVKVDGTAEVSLDSGFPLSVHGRVVVMWLSRRIEYGEAVTVSYSVPESRRVQGLAGAPRRKIAPALNDQVVRNKALEPVVIVGAPETLIVGNGENATYTLKLGSQPDANVTVTASVGAAATVFPRTVTFTPSTWSTAQTVRVTGVNVPGGAEKRVSIRHAVAGYGDVTTADAVNVVVLRSVCDRSTRVRNAIMRALSGVVSSCSDVRASHLRTIRTLECIEFAPQSCGASSPARTLKVGDFGGLTSLERLSLYNNMVGELPSGIFDTLSSLKELTLTHMGLRSLDVNVFRELSSLRKLNLNNNELTGLPSGVLQGLGALRFLHLRENNLGSLPSKVFAGLKLTRVDLRGNNLRSLPNGIFAPLSRAISVGLASNPGAPFKPVVSAGVADIAASPGEKVTLAGEALGPWGNGKVNWSWQQVNGPRSTAPVSRGVALSLATARAPSFKAPSTAVTLYFKLVATPTPAPSVENGTAPSDPDWISVTVSAESGMQQVTGVSVSDAPGGDGQWDAGEHVEAVLTFDAAVTVDTTNGTPSVQVDLGTGAVRQSAGYVSGSGTTALTFRYTLAAGEGPYTQALLVANSLATGGGTIRGTESNADAALAHDGAATAGAPVSGSGDGPTASFSNVPANHDGESAFEIGLAFSAAPDALGYRTVRDTLLEVAGGQVVRAWRTTQGSNAAWRLTVQPAGPGDVTLTLPARACTETNAVCFGGRPLSSAATATVAGAPVTAPVTASFDGAPAEHDGSAFTVNFRISVEPYGLPYRTVRDSLFDVTGATIAKARRLTQGSNKGWELTVDPSGFGAVTLALVATTDCDGTPGVCDAADRMLAGPLSLTVEGPPTLAVADAEIDEAANVTLDFTVTLSRSLSEAVTVAYATSDGTATAGSDYTAAGGTLTFAAGDTQKTVSVAVLDDAHDEGSETVTLTLSNPSPARVKLADATATGTIRNTDLMPAAWTARFGRTVAEQVIETVDSRMQAARTPGVEVTVAGERLDGQTPAAEASGAGEAAAGQPVALADWLRDATDPNAEDPRSRAISNRDLLLGSTFLLTAADDAPGTGGATYSLWGRSAVSSFDGRDGDLTVDGEVVSAMLGADWSRGHMLAGLIVGHSSGDGGYRASAGAGEVASTLTGLYPWGRYALSERLDVWAAAGYGEGRLTLTPDGQDAIRADLDLWMGAIGLRGDLVDGGANGLSLTSKTDALLVETSTAAVEGLAATASSVTRLRLAVEGTLPVRLSNGWVMTPAVELGLRHDGGDAETGFGLDVGAGLVWRAERLGLSAEIRGRGLVTHEASGFRDVGLSGSLAWRPAVDERGPSVSLAQTYGGSSSGGVGALLERGTLSGLSATGAGEALDGLHRQRLEARFGYGVPAFGDTFTWIPEVGVGVSETGRDYRLGWRLVRVGRGSASAVGRLELSLEAMRRESAVDGAAKPEHSVGMRLTAPF